MIARGLSARRACDLLRLSRSSFAYKRAPSRNVELTARLRDMASREPKLGYRMAWSRLRTEFAPLNVKRVRRIWRDAGLGVGTKPRRCIEGARKPDLSASKPREVWCIDFAHDACANGTKFKCLAVVDEATRECLAMELSRRIPSERVVQALQQAFEEFGTPEHLRCDNGPEFTPWAMRLFLEGRGVRHALIQPGSPWQNGFAESFIGTFRSECPDPEVFRNLADAQLKIALWVKFYNEDRPHSSLGYIEPRTFREKWNEISSLMGETVV